VRAGRPDYLLPEPGGAGVLLISAGGTQPAVLLRHSLFVRLTWSADTFACARSSCPSCAWRGITRFTRASCRGWVRLLATALVKRSASPNTGSHRASLLTGALWSLRCCVPFIAGTVSERRRALAVRRRVAACCCSSLAALQHLFLTCALRTLVLIGVSCAAAVHLARVVGAAIVNARALRCTCARSWRRHGAVHARRRGGGMLAVACLPYTQAPPTSFPFGVAACLTELPSTRSCRRCCRCAGGASPASGAASRGGCPSR
jgi:hypothetical protein